MSHDTVGIEADFATRDSAHAAKSRLVRAGFARNSIDIFRSGDGFVVRVPIREENRARAARLLKGTALVERAKHGGLAAADRVGSQPLLALALAGLAGFVLYGLTNRR